MKALDAVNLAQQIIKSHVVSSAVAVDATAGNGYDTLFLAQNMPPSGMVWSFDIQEQALIHTRELLEKHNCNTKVHLIQDNHANVENYLGKNNIDVAVFNLGYLPGGNHAITTTSEDVCKALHVIFTNLRQGGLVSIVTYPGHATGRLEAETVRTFLLDLSAKVYRVGAVTMLNQNNNPPVLYLVEKVRSEVFEGVATR